MNGACLERFETGPESIQIGGLTNHATSIFNYFLTYCAGGAGGSTVVKLQTLPFTVLGGLNSSTRQ